MKRPILAVALRLTVFAAVMGVFLVGVLAAVQRPVGGETASYTADFTDANGLKTGDDVRMFGVQVGKVRAISLHDGLARVEFTVRRARPVYDTSTLAIRYQSLTGQRYIAVRQADSPGTVLPGGALIGTARTLPSFDITTLFNGLQPVLSELSPASLNQFGTSMLAVIQGDGTGIGPALAAIGELSSRVRDRQALISRLIENFQQVSDQLGGRAPAVVTLIDGLSQVFRTLYAQFDQIVEFALNATPVLAPIDSLLATVGFTTSANPDLDNALRTAFPDPDAARELLGRLPGLLQTLTAAVPVRGAYTCSGGKAEVPMLLRVLVAGEQVAICHG